MSDMTTAVAIDLIDNLIGMVDDNQGNDYDTAFHMAIDALKAQADGDTISRQAAIDAVDESLTRVFVEHRDIAEKMINKIPSAQPEKRTEERTETHARDCISRKEAIDADHLKRWIISRGLKSQLHPADIIDQIDRESTIEPRCETCEAFNKTRLLIPQPQRKKGHWIRHPEQRNIFNGKTIECSECHEKYTVQYVEDELFCRHCGADMREPEDIPMEYFESGGR